VHEAKRLARERSGPEPGQQPALGLLEPSYEEFPERAIGRIGHGERRDGFASELVWSVSAIRMSRTQAGNFVRSSSRLISSGSPASTSRIAVPGGY